MRTRRSGNRRAVWGRVGCNGHAYHQLLHQAQLIPADFASSRRYNPRMADHHQVAVRQLLSQSRALMLGKSREARAFAGELPKPVRRRRHLAG